MDYLSYDVASNSQINFTGFTAEEGEIFIGYLDYKPVSSQLIVDGKAISVTGELAVGVTDFSVGTPFEVAKYPSAQVGAVMVFRNGVLQARNSDNSSTTLDGNYYEIDSGDGLGSVIRFNTAPAIQADGIVVVSNGLLIERPTGSIMAEVESLAGQIDAMIPALAAATGLAESAFQAAPNNVDLRTFGNQVIDHEERIDDLEDANSVKLYMSATQSIPTNIHTRIAFDTAYQGSLAGWTNGSGYNSGTGTWTVDPKFTAQKSGYYSVAIKIRFTDNANFQNGESAELTLDDPTIRWWLGEQDVFSTTGRCSMSGSTIVKLLAGQSMYFNVYQNSGVSETLGGHESAGERRTHVSIKYLGE
jgi:hypothetical protein